jgi:nucleotide-binding universal stress UspA family protein
MRILLAIDGSPNAEDALESVKARPWPPGTTIRIISAVPPVLPPPPIPAWAGPPAGFAELQAQRKKDAEVLVERVAEGLRDRGLACDTVVGMGDARGEILSEAERWPADLIVMGSCGLSGLKRWILGSVALYVVSHAPCSVEVVRGREMPAR